MNRTLTYIIQPEDNAVKIKYFLRCRWISSMRMKILSQ